MDTLQDFCPADPSNTSPTSTPALPPQNNIYTKLTDSDAIDMDKIESILHYLDKLLVSWYPSRNTDPDQGPVGRILTSSVHRDTRPHLHSQLDILNDLPIDNNTFYNATTPNTTTTTTTTISTQRHNTYHTQFDSLTTFNECESHNDVLNFINNLPPKTLSSSSSSHLSSSSSSSSSSSHLPDSIPITIPLPSSLTQTSWYSTLSSHLPNHFSFDGVYIPYVHTVTPTALSQYSSCSILFFGLKLMSVLPIVLISTLILFDWKVTMVDWFYPALLTTRQAYLSYHDLTIDGDPISPSIDASLNPYGVGLLPTAIIQRPIAFQLCMALYFIYIAIITAAVPLLLISFWRCHFTSNRLQEHLPTFGYYSELQRRTIYTYYCLINYHFPPEPQRDEHGNVTAPAQNRSEYLMTPFPNLLPLSLTTNQRLRRSILCQPDQFLSISRCSKCEANIYRPPGCHHCSVCGCTADLDHHCVFIGSDVGRFNHKYFLTFLFWAAASSLLYSPVGWYMVSLTLGTIATAESATTTINKVINEDGMLILQDNSTAEFVYSFAVFFCTLLTTSFAFVLTGFAYFHFGLVMDAKTTFDRVMGARNGEGSDGSNLLNDDGDGGRINTSGTSWGKNGTKNLSTHDHQPKSLWQQRLERVLGPSKLLWLIPYDTMYFHRYSHKSELFLTNQAHAEQSDRSNINQPLYSSIAQHDATIQSISSSSSSSSSKLKSSIHQRSTGDDDDDLDDLDDDEELGQISTVPSLQNDFASHDLTLIRDEDELYYTKHVYLDDEYFFPYQFTHHLFSNLVLLKPEQYMTNEQQIEYFNLNYNDSQHKSVNNPHLLQLQQQQQQQQQQQPQQTISPSEPPQQRPPLQPLESSSPPQPIVNPVNPTPPTTTAVTTTSPIGQTPSKPRTLQAPPTSISSQSTTTTTTLVNNSNPDLLSNPQTSLQQQLQYIQQNDFALDNDETLSIVSFMDNLDSDFEDLL